MLSTTVHEFGHAWMATRLGDPLPRAQGRLTLSPVRHVDPIGTLLMPFMAVFWSLPLIAWGKPVRTDPRAYSTKISRSTGSMLVSISGPLMNLALALVVTIILVVGGRTGLMSQTAVAGGAEYLVFLNIVLMAINLIPIHPLDGGAIVDWILPPSLQGVSDFLRRWGSMILLAALFVPSVFQTVLAPVYGLAETAKDLVVQVASR